MSRPAWLPAPHRLLLLFFGIVLPLLAAGAVAEYLLDHERFTFEQPLMLWLHAHTAPWMIYGSLLLHWLGTPPLAAAWALLLALWQRRLNRPARAVFIALSAALSAALMYAAKSAFRRPRPEFWPRIVTENGASFPSGHSTYAAAMAAVFILLYWKTPQRLPVTAAALLFALLMGISRIILGVHYPSDVLVGWMTGSTTAIGLYLLMTRHKAV